MSANVLYFAYGSNLLPVRIEARLGPCRALGQAWLDAYSLRFHKRATDGSGKADAYRTGTSTDRLYGNTFEISALQKRQLDGFEGPGYRCKWLTVESRTGPVTACIYLAKPDEIDPALVPFDWYHQLVEQGAREAGFPPHYVQQIAQVNARSDPDTVRSRKHFSLLGNPSDV